MGTELATAIDALYEAFNSYARPERFEACACCWDGEPIGDPPGPHMRGRVLALAPGGSRPVGELRPEEVGSIIDSVPLTSGSLKLLKHYLPRILEIVAGEGLDWPSIEIAFYRLNDGPDVSSMPWTQWPSGEREALRSFFHALWIDRLGAVHEDEHAVDDALCAIGVIEPDFEWYLAEWLKFEQPAAATNLLRFLEVNADDMVKGRLWNAFWEHQWPADANLRKVLAWVNGDATRQAVEGAMRSARTIDESSALASIAERWS